MNIFSKIILIMAGGSIGAILRYVFSVTAAKYMGTRFPWGTLFANMTGCFLIGIAFALSEKTHILSPSMRLFFMTGFLGALTTFSTYALETTSFLRMGSYVAVTNFLINNIGGGVLIFAGIRVVNFILSR